MADERAGLDFLSRVYSRTVHTPDQNYLVEMDKDHLIWQLLNCDQKNLPAFARDLTALIALSKRIGADLTPRTGVIVSEALADICESMLTGIVALNSKDAYLLGRVSAPSVSPNPPVPEGIDNQTLIQKILNKNQN